MARRFSGPELEAHLRLARKIAYLREKTNTSPVFDLLDPLVQELEGGCEIVTGEKSLSTESRVRQYGQLEAQVNTMLKVLAAFAHTPAENETEAHR